MAFVTVEDIYGQIEVIFFPKVFEKAKDILAPEQVVRISGRLQIKDGVPQIIADGADPLDIKEEVAAEKQVEQEFLGLILPDDVGDKVDDILDILTSYPGNIQVIIAMNGKKYNAHAPVRRCDGLMSELKNYLSEKDIIFFKKK